MSKKEVLLIDFATNWEQCFYSSSVNHLHRIFTSIGYLVTVIGYDDNFPSSLNLNIFTWIALASDTPEKIKKVEDIHCLPSWLRDCKIPIYGLGYGGLILAKHLGAKIVERNNLNSSKLVTELREKQQITGQRFFNQQFAIIEMSSNVSINGINENQEIASFNVGNFFGIIYQPEYPIHFDPHIWEGFLLHHRKSPSRLV
jgi:GMP synthase-like glutamine amidotransferase